MNDQNSLNDLKGIVEESLAAARIRSTVDDNNPAVDIPIYIDTPEGARPLQPELQSELETLFDDDHDDFVQDRDIPEVEPLDPKYLSKGKDDPYLIDGDSEPSDNSAKIAALIDDTLENFDEDAARADAYAPSPDEEDFSDLFADDEPADRPRLTRLPCSARLEKPKFGIFKRMYARIRGAGKPQFGGNVVEEDFTAHQQEIIEAYRKDEASRGIVGRVEVTDK